MASADYTLRLATRADILTIQAIEADAAAKFLAIPELADIATAVVMPAPKLQTWLSQGRIYLATHTPTSRAIGLVATYPFDSSLLIGEVSVSVEHNGKGVGGMLLRAVFAWAEEAGKRVSLFTYREVPWNRAWYERFGFREVRPETLGKMHVEKFRLDEEVRGLVRPGFTRCCMLRDVVESP